MPQANVSTLSSLLFSARNSALDAVDMALVLPLPLGGAQPMSAFRASASSSVLRGIER
ncbi:MULTISPECIES: hypothetical protein [unclassified Pseudomonas]|uniref:hypothetical protein n=1 Tax=unclassified Pseudomonas TaxID=196821 RepID=UPI002AC981D1|nr:MULTISPECIES: hypothetical protein [unclassified Pseudomonas]MEB0045953.1 hypothetical protein [Pseudomonas sp. Dout3]MEB0097213.1 hypothetical protein [Pseudomonas sp. DC1.2]WPX56849.1 hypothetical protein RHM68_14390 [Pseudomonas sp. DC1.2]